MNQRVRLESIHPLVRYVDQEQAVIDAHFTTLPAVVDAGGQPPRRTVDVFVEIDGSDGFHDEGHTRVQLAEHRGSIRFEIVHPQRWWPAGMGEQALYTLSLTVFEDGLGQAEALVTFGLSSIRRDRVLGEGFEDSLLVNGRICDIDSVVVVDRINENRLLPANGETLLVVRDHFGPDRLYDAADRAGILLMQCVPIHPEARIESELVAQMARLVPHPSLAGYFVGHLGALSDQVAQMLRWIDPTRPVYQSFPLFGAA